MNKAMLQKCVDNLQQVVDGTYYVTHTGLCNGPIHSALAAGSHEHAFVMGLMARWSRKSGAMDYPVVVGQHGDRV